MSPATSPGASRNGADGPNPPAGPGGAISTGLAATSLVEICFGSSDPTSTTVMGTGPVFVIENR